MGFGVWGFGFRVYGLGFRISGFGFRVKGLQLAGGLHARAPARELRGARALAQQPRHPHLVKFDGHISFFPPGKRQALWAMGGTVFMALGSGRHLPPGPAGRKTVVEARGNVWHRHQAMLRGCDQVAVASMPAPQHANCVARALSHSSRVIPTCDPAHKKTPPPRTPQWAYAYGPMCGYLGSKGT